MDGWMDGSMDGWMDGWIDVCRYLNDKCKENQLQSPNF